MGCFFQFCQFQEERPLLFDDLEDGLKRRERDIDKRENLNGLGLNVKKSLGCQWKKWRKDSTNEVKEFFKSNFPFQPSISKNSLIEKKSNVENYLVSSIADLKFQRKCILNSKTFLNFSRTLKMNEVNSERTWISLQKATNCYPEPERCWFPVSSLSEHQISHHFCYFNWKKVWS